MKRLFGFFSFFGLALALVGSLAVHAASAHVHESPNLFGYMLAAVAPAPDPVLVQDMTLVESASPAPLGPIYLASYLTDGLVFRDHHRRE